MRKPASVYFASLEKADPAEITLEPLGAGRFRAKVGDRLAELDVLELPHGGLSLLVDGKSFDVRLDDKGEKVRVAVRDQQLSVDVVDERRRRLRAAAGHRVSLEGAQTIAAPMPGKVVRVLVKPGDEVAEGQGVVVVEAMKMENELKSPKAGKVTEVVAREGQAVEGGAKLLVVE
jgi:biotin carboxyl carrier protein